MPTIGDYTDTLTHLVKSLGTESFCVVGGFALTIANNGSEVKDLDLIIDLKDRNTFLDVFAKLGWGASGLGYGDDDEMSNGVKVSKGELFESLEIDLLTKNNLDLRTDDTWAMQGHILPSELSVQVLTWEWAFLLKTSPSWHTTKDKISTMSICQARIERERAIQGWGVEL